MTDNETAPEMLARLGTDAMLWAQEFNKTAVRLGYSEMDEGWLIGWFANAIENCDMIRCNRIRAELATVTAERDRMREALRPFSDAASTDDYIDDVEVAETDTARKITFGDLRRARLALEETPK